MDLFKEEQLSDDEIFVGKFSLKEVKRRVLWNKQRDMYHEPENVDRSIKIIETHSAPDIQHMDSKLQVAPPQLKATSNPVLSPLSSPNSPWDNKYSDDSFLKIEKMVTDLSVSNQQNSDVALDNTSDYILKNGPSQKYANPNIITNIKREIPEDETFTEINSVTKLQQYENPTSKDNEKYNKTQCITPLKTHVKCKKTEAATPSNSNINSDFKTPGIPASRKKTPHSLLKKSFTYKHVASPVALYINKSPSVPLIRQVRPVKPLPGHSAIPKFVKNPQCKPSNKENVNLPTVAYKSAKKTEVINISDDEKLPQSQWAHKVASSLPRPLVMKHEHREMNIAKKLFMSKADKSYADLSLQQADVSVCTQKSAFNSPKKN